MKEKNQKIWHDPSNIIFKSSRRMTSSFNRGINSEMRYIWIFHSLEVSPLRRKQSIKDCILEGTYGFASWGRFSSQGCWAACIMATLRSLARCETSTTLSTISWTAVTLGKNWAACFVFCTVCASASFRAFAHCSTRVRTSLRVTFRCTVSPICTSRCALNTTNLPCARKT